MNSNPTNPNAKIGDEEFVRSKHENVWLGGMVFSPTKKIFSGPINKPRECEELGLGQSESEAWSDARKKIEEPAASRLRAEEGIGEATPIGGSMKFRKKPVVIEASRWYKNGDHPLDGDERFPEKATPKGLTGGPDDPRYSGEFAGQLYEGKVVRYFRRPDVNGGTICKHCNLIMHDHGWIDTLEGGHIVCPGDWIITGVKGERYPCKPDIFEATYERVTE